MKMDNGIKIFNYYGEKVYEETVDELYQVEWRPYIKGTYPQKEIVAKVGTTTTATAKYRHPNFTGRGGPVGSKVLLSDSLSCSSIQPKDSGPTRYTPAGAASRGPVGGTPIGGGPIGGSPAGSPGQGMKPTGGPFNSDPRKKGTQAQGRYSTL